MDLAEVFSQVFDLELALCASIEIQRVFELPICIPDVTVTRLRILFAVDANHEFAVCCFEQQHFGYLDEFVADFGIDIFQTSECEDAVIALHMFQEQISQQR